jgi:hypothetical protein
MQGDDFSQNADIKGGCDNKSRSRKVLKISEFESKG